MDSLCDMFRANMPPGFARGRRFPRNLSHAAISGWTAEECLVFLRIEWRYICSQFLHMWHESGKETPEIFQVVMEGLTLFSNAIAPFLDRRGCQSSMEQLRDAAVKYVRHMVHAQVDGQRVYSLAFCTHTQHMVLHLWRHLGYWGDLFEHWCFLFERMASEITTLLVGWNGTEAGAYIGRRLSMKATSTRHMKKVARVAAR